MLRFLRYVLPVLSMGAAAACLPARDSRANLPVHLVIDAGSSGTRFCLFAIEREGPGTCKAQPLDTAGEPCLKVSARTGLAHLDDAERRRVLTEGIGAVRSRAGASLRATTLLGTGGFRQLTQVERLRALSSTSEILATLVPGAAVHAIDGQEEGKLAWLAVRQATGLDVFTAMEVGGATVQLTAPGPEGLQAVSFPFGQNAMFSHIQRRQNRSLCAAGTGPEVFEKCRAAVASVVGEMKTEVARGRFQSPPLFGLGAPWAAVFDLARRDSVTGPELDRLGREFCSKDLEATVAAGVPRAFAARTCFLLSLQSALFAASGHNTIRRGRESWPRGAASSAYFPACRKAAGSR